MKDYEKIVNKFINGETKGKSGKYTIEGNRLAYKTLQEFRYIKPYQDNKLQSHINTIDKLRDAVKNNLIVLTDKTLNDLNENTCGVDYKALSSNTIATRLSNGQVIGNSSILPLVGRRMAFGNEVLNRQVAPVQTYMSTKIPMIPFSVFTESKLDINNLVVVDRGAEETVTRKTLRAYTEKGERKTRTIIQKVHFTGASLFRLGSKHFLFDIDRREVEHKIFNPFLVELPRTCGTIKDAYASLMPKEVSQAIKAKKKVLRQGEWFFIPSKVSKAMLTRNKVFGVKTDPTKEYWRRETLKLQAGTRNRPNYAQTGFVENKTAFVTGTVIHLGREHADLVLKGWYKALPNTAFDKSFTITGDVD